MYRKIKILIITILIPYSYLFCQVHDQHPSFSLSIAGAISFVGPQRYYFLQGNISTPMSVGLFGAIGVVYDPITLKIINPVKISLSTELSLYEKKTEEPSSSNYNTQLKFQMRSVLVWTKFYLPVSFSPFVRIGIGVSNIKLQERYGIDLYEDINLHGQSLTIGLGGGIDISISENVVSSVFCDAFSKPRDISFFHNDGRPWATMQFSMGSVVGLRAKIKL